MVFLVTALFPQMGWAASFVIQPKQSQLGLSCTGSATVYIHTGSQPVNAADMVIAYDASMVDKVRITPGSFFETYADQFVGSGRIRLTGFSITKNSSGSGVFATLHYTAVKTGTAPFTIQFLGPYVTTDSNIASAQTSDDVLTSVTNATISVTKESCSASTTPTARASSPTVPSKPRTVDSCQKIGCTQELLCAQPDATIISEQLACTDAGDSVIVTPLPHSTVAVTTLASGSMPKTSVYKKRVVLSWFGSTTRVVPGIETYVEMPLTSFVRPPTEMQLLISDAQYIAVFRPEQQQFDLTFVSPTSPGTYRSAFVYYFADGSREVQPFDVHVLRSGGIEGLTDVTHEAEITLYEGREPWDGGFFGQQNPLTVGKPNPFYQFAVTSGVYRLAVRAHGYQPYFSRTFFANGFVTEPVRLIPYPSSILDVDGWLDLIPGWIRNLRENPRSWLTLIPWDLVLWPLIFIAWIGMGRYHWMHLRILWLWIRYWTRREHLIVQPGQVYNEQTNHPVSFAVFIFSQTTKRAFRIFGFSNMHGQMGCLLQTGVYHGLVYALGYRPYSFEERVQTEAGVFRPMHALTPDPWLTTSTVWRRWKWRFITCSLGMGGIIVVLLAIVFPSWMHGMLVVGYLYAGHLRFRLPVHFP